VLVVGNVVQNNCSSDGKGSISCVDPETATDVDLYDTGNGTLTVGTAVVLNDITNYKHIKSAMSSPDQQSSSHIALKLEVEDTTDRGTVLETLTCGRFMDSQTRTTDLVCNPYSSVIGFTGVAMASNGALTEITATSVPIFGGVSAAQLSAY
jgi:hypothetical protein